MARWVDVCARFVARSRCSSTRRLRPRRSSSNAVSSLPLAAATLLAATASTAVPVHAQDGADDSFDDGATFVPPPPSSGLPVAQHLRPLTVPEGTLQIIGGPGAASQLSSPMGAMGAGLTVYKPAAIAVPDPFGGNATTVSPDVTVGLAAGAAYGVSDDIEVGSLLLPIVLSPEGDFGNISLFGTYRLQPDATEIGLRAQLVLPTQGDFAIDAGVPFILRATDEVRVDTGGFLGLAFGDETTSQLRAPVAVSYQITEAIAAGVHSGFSLTDFDFDTFAIPLGIHGGYSIAGDAGPLADVTMSLGFPQLLVPGADDAFDAGTFAFQVGANVYLSL